MTSVRGGKKGLFWSPFFGRNQSSEDMADPGDIWQRYDAKVMQIQVMEARVAAIETELAQTRDERDHWARVCRDLGKKLSVARTLAERLRSAERAKVGRPETTRFRRPAELQSAAQGSSPTAVSGQIKDEYDRAREVLGLVLTALTKALDDDAAAELGRKLRHHAGGKLLLSITRGSLTLVPVDGRYMVDRKWLDQLDLAALRQELDVAAQSGIYELPEDSLASGLAVTEMEVDLDADDEDDSGVLPLPPPPPLSAGSYATLPPLLSALPDESEAAIPRQSMDTVRTTAPMKSAPLIPNLRIGRLIKTPGTT